jgi:hypothetical protein
MCSRLHIYILRAWDILLSLLHRTLHFLCKVFWSALLYRQHTACQPNQLPRVMLAPPIKNFDLDRSI